MLSDIPMILQNLYTRGVGSNPQEYLTKMSNGDYEFTQLVIPPPQQLRLNQTVQWAEGESERSFDGVQISAAGAITFGSNADASDFFNDLRPTPVDGGGFITSSGTTLLDSVTRSLRLRAPIGSPVGIVNNIVTFTGSTTVATSTPITIIELRAAAFEGGVSQLYNFPNSYFVTSTGDDFTLTIPSTDGDFTRIRNTLSIIENGRMVLTNDEDGSKAFYSVTVTTNSETSVIFALTALSSVAGNGMLGLAGRTACLLYTSPSPRD